MFDENEKVSGNAKICILYNNRQYILQLSKNQYLGYNEII